MVTKEDRLTCLNTKCVVCGKALNKKTRDNFVHGYPFGMHDRCVKAFEGQAHAAPGRHLLDTDHGAGDNAGDADSATQPNEGDRV